MIDPQSKSEGTWLPLVEYATKKNISLSTLRRYIKADKVVYKVEQKRYLLWDESPASHQGEVYRLQRELKKAHEEIAELKTLIAFYEEQIPLTFSGS